MSHFVFDESFSKFFSSGSFLYNEKQEPKKKRQFVVSKSWSCSSKCLRIFVVVRCCSRCRRHFNVIMNVASIISTIAIVSYSTTGTATKDTRHYTQYTTDDNNQAGGMQFVTQHAISLLLLLKSVVETKCRSIEDFLDAVV